MANILFIMLKSVIAFILLLCLTRVVGRKTLSQMTFFDYTVSITMGSLTATLCIGDDRSPITVGIVLILFGSLAILTSFLVIKSAALRKLFVAKPVIVISKGELVKKNMKKIRITAGMLSSLLREKDAFNIMDVEYAIMEDDGKLSVLLKSDKQPLTPYDMNLTPPYKGLATEIIVDGKLILKNLPKAGRTTGWIEEELNKRGLRLEHVFFATIDSSGKLYVTLGIGNEND